MNRLISAVILSLALSCSADANLVDVSLDGSNGGMFSGLGTSMATYTVNVDIADIDGGFDTYQLVIGMNSTNGPVNRDSTMTGVGVGSTVMLPGGGLDGDSIDDDETLALSFMLTPIDPNNSLVSFQFAHFDHGQVTGFGGTGQFAFGARVTDGVTSADLSQSFATVVDDTSIATFSGTSFVIESFTGSAAPQRGGVEGIFQLSFEASSAPEPSSFLLCAFCMYGFASRRRRSC